MASKQSQELSYISKAENLNRQVDQYRSDLNIAISGAVERIIRENERFLSAFSSGSSSKEMIMKSLMEFAAEPSNVDEFADMIGDITTNLPDLGALNMTISAIVDGRQFRGFVMSLLGVFKENLGKGKDDKQKFTGDELIWEISQTVADYVADLTVDFVWDKVINEDDDVET